MFFAFCFLFTSLFVKHVMQLFFITFQITNTCKLLTYTYFMLFILDLIKIMVLSIDEIEFLGILIFIFLCCLAGIIFEYCLADIILLLMLFNIRLLILNHLF